MAIVRDLFGGAIKLPVNNSFLDASQIRQVPDNQEVFVDMNTQQSLIIELLEPVEHEHEDAAKFHFQQLAEDNDALSYEVHSIERLNPVTTAPHLPSETTLVYLLQGSQQVAKFNEAKENAYNTVAITMMVIRLKQVTTDLVISMNAPVAVAPGSSEQPSTTNDLTAVAQDMMGMISQLKIEDWGLFGA
ncbi:uncharacterized protein BYT42DRAFT_496453 [Radiomyces spectabilis]|uniref:uncharacterized protein n=1 Tax=Radiomyces spectabilis TaxID=64574 RepID=UPI00221FA255|nr:uncharacterized protein BYT42DRAFT_496453 [Radiomyces spectabilis]KAI8379625.1 hypothetical protein BYT42DRAFT_496453 [Radiomyces spectabilis]